MRLNFIIGLLLLGVIGSGAAWYFLRPVPEWQEQVLKRLKDPESAQFRNIKVDEVTDWVCGEVNSKNSLGGYVGFKRFMVQPPTSLSREEWQAKVDAPYRSTWVVTFEDDYAAVVAMC